jgi:dihydrofolate reductase
VVARLTLKLVTVSNHPTLSLIAAVARNGAIGKDNALLWSEPQDQQHFRRVTLGCPVIMGRKTWESLPERFRPLPGRRNVVLTRHAQFQAQGAEVVSSLEQALQLLAGHPKAFVIGGAEIYALALPLANELILTEIDIDFAGDTYFPVFEKNEYVRCEHSKNTGANGVQFTFVTYSKMGVAL